MKWAAFYLLVVVFLSTHAQASLNSSCSSLLLSDLAEPYSDQPKFTFITMIAIKVERAHLDQVPQFIESAKNAGVQFETEEPFEMDGHWWLTGGLGTADFQALASWPSVKVGLFVSLVLEKMSPSDPDYLKLMRDLQSAGFQTMIATSNEIQGAISPAGFVQLTALPGLVSVTQHTHFRDTDRIPQLVALQGFTTKTRVLDADVLNLGPKDLIVSGEIFFTGGVELNACSLESGAILKMQKEVEDYKKANQTVYQRLRELGFRVEREENGFIVGVSISGSTLGQLRTALHEFPQIEAIYLSHQFKFNPWEIKTKAQKDLF